MAAPSPSRPYLAAPPLHSDTFQHTHSGTWQPVQRPRTLKGQQQRSLLLRPPRRLVAVTVWLVAAAAEGAQWPAPFSSEQVGVTLALRCAREQVTTAERAAEVGVAAEAGATHRAGTRTAAATALALAPQAQHQAVEAAARALRATTWTWTAATTMTI